MLRGPLVALGLLALALPAGAATDDGGSGGDAGDDFASATPVATVGRHAGSLGAGDEDWFRFFVPAGASIDIDVNVGLLTGQLQVGDAPQRLGVGLYDPSGVLLDSPLTNVGDARVTWPRALVAGEYRLALSQAFLPETTYDFCFVVDATTCATLGLRSIDLLTPLPSRHAEVLLIPPTMANPGGSETAIEYLDATLAGIRDWAPAIDAFATDYPQYAYLRELSVNVEVFDGAPQRAGYDVLILWSPYTGPVFRGVAINPWGGGILQDALCPSGTPCDAYHQLEPLVHDGGRVIVMSSFAAAPRSGQVTPDFPETADVYNVMLHEFAHTWGLGHTQTWTAAGPDLMNSPYARTFGDGDPLGDGGERSPRECITSLDLYGLAELYEWIGRGVPFEQREIFSSVPLPASVPYETYCP